MRLKRIFPLALWLHPLLFHLTIAQDDFLFQVAQEESQRRAGIGTPTRLFSNQHLSQLANARVTVALTTTAAGRSGKSQTRDEKRMTASEQPLLDFWRSALRDAGIRLSTSLNRLHVLQLKLNELHNHYLNASEDLQRMRLEAELARTLDELKAAEAGEAKAREVWHRVRKEALRVGLKADDLGDFGWVPPKRVSVFDDSGGRDP